MNMHRRKDFYKVTDRIKSRMQGGTEEDDEELTIQQGVHTWAPENTVYSLDISFRNTVTEQSQTISQPTSILLPLRDHQRALVHAMLARERASQTGIHYKNTVTYTNYGVLGDEVGSGKSLTILALLAHEKEQNIQSITKQLMIHPKSTSHLFSVFTKKLPTHQHTPSLIIVPHTIYRQWQDYCKQQTTLNIFFAKSKKVFEPLYNSIDMSGQQQLLQSIQSCDAVLVSNTLYMEVQNVAAVHKIQWKRIFVDEADSVFVPGTAARPDAYFIWFVTATWPNFLMWGNYLRLACLQHYEANRTKYLPQTGEFIRSELGLTNHHGPYPQYVRTKVFTIQSPRWLGVYNSEHPMRGLSLVMCDPTFLQSSRQMPLIQSTTILCQQPATHRALHGLVSHEIQSMLHGGNIQGVLQEFGIEEDTPMNLLTVLTVAKEKELERLQKTIAFKESIDYATPQAKEQALQNLRAKIESVEEQLVTIRDRLTSIDTKECPICYEDPMIIAGTMTPCCKHIFCGECILKCLSRKLACPLCRTLLTPEQLKSLVKEKKPKQAKSAPPQRLTKPKQLIQFLQENPQARILVFCRYENPFETLEKECEEHGITYHTLRGNKDAIASCIRSFDAGEKRVLFLPTQTAGAGINLVSATHVLLYHAMTPEEEKQVIGRAYRLGRTEPLNVIRFLHEGETVHTARA